jgi:PIN domain nuclease of toxin-antitoxin system
VEPLIFLDTHVVVWLFAGARDRLRPARRQLEKHELLISPIVKLELRFLWEIGRVTVGPEDIIADLVHRVGLRCADTPFDSVMDASLQQTWTRDPFDRIIVGQAAVEGLPLLTADRTIRQHYAQAVWNAQKVS